MCLWRVILHFPTLNPTKSSIPKKLSHLFTKFVLRKLPRFPLLLLHYLLQLTNNIKTGKNQVTLLLLLLLLYEGVVDSGYSIRQSMGSRSSDLSWRRHLNLRTLYLLLLGQVVSFSMAMASFTSSLIADLGVDAPLIQMFFPYVALAVVYGSILVYRRRKLMVPWYWYLLLGFVDVQGNYLVNKAYQFSSITSVTLLDCFTIAWVIVLTWIFLGSRYSLLQLFGAAISVLGLGLVMLSDAGIAGGGGSRPLLGDFLVIGGTVFFAISNTSQEFCVKKKDRVEFLCLLGLFGFLVSLVQISIMERTTAESIEWTTDIILAFIGFAVSISCFYSMAPFVIKMSGATMFNLSLLTSDMWAVVVRIFIYQQEVDWLYYLAFSVVLIGLVFYSLTYVINPSPPNHLDFLLLESALLIENPILITAIKNHLITTYRTGMIRKKRDDLFPELHPSGITINNHIFDMPDFATISQELFLDEYTSRGNNLPSTNILDHANHMVLT